MLWLKEQGAFLLISRHLGCKDNDFYKNKAGFF
jgi:hypothetical protein